MTPRMIPRYTVKIENREDGFWLIVGNEIHHDRYTFPLENAESLYDTVKAEIGPWLYERDQANQNFIRSSAGFITPQGREEAARVFKG